MKGCGFGGRWRSGTVASNFPLKTYIWLQFFIETFLLISDKHSAAANEKKRCSVEPRQYREAPSLAL